MYDRNRVTHIASTVGNYWLEPIATVPYPNEEKQQDAVEDIHPPFEGSYRNKSDISKEESKKMKNNECIFTYSDEEEYRENWAECVEFCKENENLCM